MAELIYKTLIEGGAWKTLLVGLGDTVKISVLALFFGTILGAGICAMRMSRIKALSLFARIYIAFFRGSPVLMVLMLMYYVIFAKIRLEAHMVAVLAYAMNSAAYIAELMRSALEATDKGQVEAARTLGFSGFDAFRLITLPQAAKVA
nr:ABC transporter permease subunit [Lachnospiraceae bacterium]